MKDSNWIDTLRQKEEKYELPAPDGLWDGIKKNLPAAPRRLRIAPWLRYGSIAAAIAILIGIGAGIGLKTNHGKPRTAPQLAAVEPPRRSEIAEVNDIHDIADKSYKAYKAYNAKLAEISESSKLSEHSDYSDISDYSDSSDTSGPSVISVPSVAPCEKAPVTPRKRRSWSLMAYAGNIMSANSGGRPDMQLMVSNSGTHFPPNSPEDDATEDNGSTPSRASRAMPSNENVHHHLPLRFGVSAGIPLAPRLNLETGVTYSLLRSTSSGSLGNHDYDSEQTLHYIGVPLKLSYDLYTGNRWTIYASAGAMAEKCVYGRLSTTYTGTGGAKSHESESVSEKKLQFSTMAGLGAAYSITHSVSVFAEPGASYYFDNHSDVNNSYKARQFNFDLKIGVRLKINNF